MTFEDHINVSSDAPLLIQDFNDLEDQDDFGEEFAKLLNYLGEQFQIGNLAEANGNFASVVPRYDSVSNVPVEGLGTAVYPDAAIVHVDGIGPMAITGTPLNFELQPLGQRDVQVEVVDGTGSVIGSRTVTVGANTDKIVVGPDGSNTGNTFGFGETYSTGYGDIKSWQLINISDIGIPFEIHVDYNFSSSHRSHSFALTTDQGSEEDSRYASGGSVTLSGEKSINLRGSMGPQSDLSVSGEIRFNPEDSPVGSSSGATISTE